MSHLSPTPSHSGLTPLLEEASKLRRFTGPPAEFWPALVSVMARLAEASRGVLIVGQAALPDKLRKLSDWTQPGYSDPALVPFIKGAPALAVKALNSAKPWNPSAQACYPTALTSAFASASNSKGSRWVRGGFPHPQHHRGQGR